VTRRGDLVRPVVAGALALGLTILAACGGDDDDSGNGGDRQEYVDALIAAANQEDDAALSAEEDACFAEAIVDAVGVDNLAAAVTPDEIRDRATTAVGDLGVEIDQAAGEAFYAGVSACVDLRALVIQAVVGTDEISDAATQCFDERLTDDLVREFMVSGFSQGDEALQENGDLVSRLQAVFTECAQP
jgi:hypothetical protein